MSNQLYDLESADIKCTLCDVGASVARLAVRDRGGKWTDVALSPKGFYTGELDTSSMGRTVAPCCGRVKDGEAVIDGRTYPLTQNEGRNHIHGGVNGCANRRWTVGEVTPSGVCFSIALEDGLDGYPGNRTLTAAYTLTGNALRVVYTAVTDRTTWVDMTNHTYWDLTGRFNGSAMEQLLEIAARRVVFNDAAHLPREIRDVDDAFDFTAPCSPGEKRQKYPDHPQLLNARGYNNAYILDPGRDYAARLYAPSSGIRMTLRTEQPAIVFYSGGYLKPSTPLNVGPGHACPDCGLALEAQGVPDPFHLPGVEPTLLRPGEAYRREIEWGFDAAADD